MRLITLNILIAYITTWVLYLSGAAEDPQMLLPAWISIATVRSFVLSIGLQGSSRLIKVQTLTVLYHLVHRKTNIRKETVLSVSVFSIASFISTVSLLMQLHLTRENDPQVPLFVILQGAWRWCLTTPV